LGMETQLRDYETFVRTLRNFDWVKDTRASGAQDIDCCIERHGSVLILEGKPRQGPQVVLPFGQWLTLKALAAQPDVTVWLVAEDQDAKTDEVPHYSVLEITDYVKPHLVDRTYWTVTFYTDGGFEHCNLAGLQAMVDGWYEEQ